MCLKVDIVQTNLLKHLDPNTEIIVYKLYRKNKNGTIRSNYRSNNYTLKPNKLVVSDRKQYNLPINTLSQDELRYVLRGIHSYQKKNSAFISKKSRNQILLKCKGKVKDLIAIGNFNGHTSLVFNRLIINIK